MLLQNQSEVIPLIKLLSRLFIKDRDNIGNEKVRRAYGIAGSAMSNAERFQYRFAWPSGDWGSLPIEGGVEVAYKSELEAAEDPAAHLEAIRERLNRVRSPFRTAEKFGVEDIIDPRDTRPLLCEFAELAWRVVR